MIVVKVGGSIGIDYEVLCDDVGESGHEAACYLHERSVTLPNPASELREQAVHLPPSSQFDIRKAKL
ncbi:MAG: hypothetical protein KGZ57_10100 [Dethiobacter sp.]|nr:hypothetical protein [Dethiobacter sp.]